MYVKLNRVAWKAGLLAVLKTILTFTIVLAASGGLDLTFSGDGKQNTNVDAAHPTWEDKAFGLAIQSNGKIVAVGESTDNATNSNFAVARYNANGSLDTTFSGDGRLITDLGGWDHAYGVAIQTNGKIVVVGTRCNDSACTVGSNLAVVRYNANGTLDTTFHGTGKQLVGFPGELTGSSGGVVIQSNGKIVAGGGVGNTSNTDIAVFRFNANGSLDNTFSGDGKQRITFGPSTSENAGWGRDVAIQPDGKIVVSGGTGNDFAVVRLNSNGTLDATFSGDGKQSTNFGGDDYSQALALQSNGKIVAVGGSTIGANNYFAVARYNANGSPDTTFSGDGKLLINFAPGTGEWAYGVAVQSNGSIVIAGSADPNGGDFAIARLKTNGALDTTFSVDGRATLDFTGGPDRARSLLLDANGKYVLAGFGSVGGHADFGLMRVLP